MCRPVANASLPPVRQSERFFRPSSDMQPSSLAGEKSKTESPPSDRSGRRSCGETVGRVPRPVARFRPKRGVTPCSCIHIILAYPWFFCQDICWLLEGSTGRDASRLAFRKQAYSASLSTRRHALWVFCDYVRSKVRQALKEKLEIRNGWREDVNAARIQIPERLAKEGRSGYRSGTAVSTE